MEGGEGEEEGGCGGGDGVVADEVEVMAVAVAKIAAEYVRTKVL